MKSGIEMIQEIAGTLELLERRFKVIEQNTKELLNRANVPPTSAPANKKKKPPEIKISSGKNRDKIVEPTTIAKAKANTIKVTGKVKDLDEKFLSGVRVRIYDANNQVAKETKTNRAGDWVSFLPIGKYMAEYFMLNVINANVKFEVKGDSKFIRVAQPVS